MGVDGLAKNTCEGEVASTHLFVMVARNSGPRLKDPKVPIKFSKIVAIEPRMTSSSSEPGKKG